MLYAIIYFLYAFTQASIMVRFGIGPGGESHDDPAKDLMGYMLFAPVFTAIGIVWVPVKALSAWAYFISGR